MLRPALQVTPCIAFDVENKEHRKMFYEFSKTNSWKNAPKFMLEKEYSSVPNMIGNKMVAYYTSKEFK